MKVHNLSYKCFVIEFNQSNTDDEIADIMKKLSEAFPSHHFLAIKLNDPVLEFAMKET